MRTMTLKLYVVLCYLISASSLFFPCLRLFKKHSLESCDAYLSMKQSSVFNHPHPGYSCRTDVSLDDRCDSPDASYRVNNKRVVIGKGRDVYQKASTIVLNMEMLNALKWGGIARPFDAQGVPHQNVLRKGDVFGTLILCYRLLWTLNPCRVVSVVNTSNLAQIGFSTLYGHLLSGDERFCVLYNEETEEVSFDMFSFSKGCGILGTLSMPLIRPIQRLFFEAMVRSMNELVSA